MQGGGASEGERGRAGGLVVQDGINGAQRGAG